MAPLPQNNTVRVWLDYSSQGNEHSLMTRWTTDPIVNVAEVQTFYENFLNGLQPFRLDDWTFLGMRYSLALSPFSLPYPLVPTITAGAQTPTPESQAKSLNFMGRTTLTGRRSMWQLFGVDFITSTDFRFSETENAAVDDGIDALNVAMAIGGMCGIDASKAVIYTYANQRINAYWQTDSRGS